MPLPADRLDLRCPRLPGTDILVFRIFPLGSIIPSLAEILDQMGRHVSFAVHKGSMYTRAAHKGSMKKRAASIKSVPLKKTLTKQCVVKVGESPRPPRACSNPEVEYGYSSGNTDTRKCVLVC